MSVGKMQPKAFIIRSGGQTGVDRGALDAAIDMDYQVAGWVPQGRLAEDGPISIKYPLAETESARYSIRTDLNVRDSDGTLIVSPRPLEGGTALTEQYAVTRRKPCLIYDPFQEDSSEKIVDWIRQANIKQLNVAGPRESKCPGIYQQTYLVVQSVLVALAQKVNL
ncbi:MAG: putative molybdenum carrier protein [Coxiellaceae bacterium]|nr:putative molybdenum carrier protein [Coxiellaceae bacterium]